MSEPSSADAPGSSGAPPRLSIVIPVYNAEKYLNACLDSVQNQTFRDFECILVDDGSLDSSGALCDERAARDARFRVIHKTNAGCAEARNTGLDAARGMWVAFIDNDDTIDRVMYAELLSAAERAGADIVCSGYVLDFGSPARNVTVLWPCDTLSRTLMLTVRVESNITNYIWIKVAKKSLYTEHGIRFNPDVGVSDDMLVSYSLVFYAQHPVIVNKAFYYYNQRNETAVSYKISHRDKDSSPEIAKKPTKDAMPLIEALYRTDTSIPPRAIDTFINQWKMARKTNALSMRHDPALFRATYPELNRLSAVSYCVRPVQKVWFLLGLTHLSGAAYALQRLSRALRGRK